MSLLSSLQTAATAIATEIATVSGMLGPTYSKDGQTVDKIGYLKELQEQLLANLDAQNAVSGGFEIRSQMAGQAGWFSGCPQG